MSDEKRLPGVCPTCGGAVNTWVMAPGESAWNPDRLWLLGPCGHTGRAA